MSKSLHPYTHTAKPGKHVRVHVFKYSYQFWSHKEHDERVFLVYDDDEETLKLVLDLINKANSSKIYNQQPREAGWEFTITPNPDGPFAFAVYYCDNFWLKPTRYCKLSKVYGTWDEAVADVRCKAVTEKGQYYEIRRLPILGTKEGGVTLARFDSIRNNCWTEEVCTADNGDRHE